MLRSSVVVLSIALLAGACLGPRSGYERASATAGATAAYRDDLVQMRTQIGLTTAALRTLIEDPSVAPRSKEETFETFARELANLTDLAAHARTTYGRMDARAELFLGRWVEDTAAIRDSDLKQGAEQRRGTLEANYERLAQGQRTVDERLEHFVAALGDLCVYFEHDLTPAGISAAGNSITRAFAEGQSLQEELGQLAHASDEACTALTPLQALAPSQEAHAAQEAHVR